jgi:hypothetical protein
MATGTPRNKTVLQKGFGLMVRTCAAWVGGATT